MMYYEYGGPGISGWLMMIIFWGLFIWLIIYIVTNISKNNSKSTNEDALEIAKKRFANGEITEKKFNSIKKKLK